MPHPLDHEKSKGILKNIYFFSDFTKVFVWITKIWKITEIGVPDHLICLLINLYAGQEATVRTGHGTIDWFKIERGV